jgi:hypothetical protein
MRFRFSSSLVLLGALVTSACGGDDDYDDLYQFSVDTTLTPTTASFPGFTEGTVRPIATLVDEEGHAVDFVENELWVSTDDEAALQDLLTQWGGVVVASVDPVEMDLEEFQPQYLIRIDASTADLDTLAEHIGELAGATEGSIRVSSDAGLQLIAVGAEEAAAGLTTGLNFVGVGSDMRDGASIEAPTGPSGYDPNVFNWPSHGSGTVQDIGVTEAWRTLDYADRLTLGSVKLAVLDMGFEPDADVANGWVGIGNVPFVDPIGTSNLSSCGSPCPWHGTNVVGAAMGVADNNFGGAGPGGPVADPVMVFTSYDFFTSITAIAEARTAGARIVNMSYSARVPVLLSWSVLPFNVATDAYRDHNNMLLFASAGNDGENVDAEACTKYVGWPCWEKAWHTPCENAGVTCIGGLAHDSTDRAEGSNYGSEHVDLFAPYTVWVGPDPSNPGNAAHTVNGTSFSSPFAAGVAALVKAADPTLDADEIEQILFSTAHTSPDSRVERYVDAAEAVYEALGSMPPNINIISPTDGEERQLNFSTTLWGSVDDPEDGFACCDITWTSDVDGTLGVGDSIDHIFTTVGERVITASATDSDGVSGATSVVLDIINTAPSVEITRPTASDTLYRGVPFVLRGTSFDPNEPGTTLDCGSMVWTSNNTTDSLGTGCDVSVTFATTGSRILTLIGTDSQGLASSDAVGVMVNTPPVDLPPQVEVTSPTNGSSVNPFMPLSLSATVRDDHDGAGDLDYEWRVLWSIGATTGSAVIGTTEDIVWTPQDTIAFDSEGRWEMTLQLTVTDTSDNQGFDFVGVYSIIVL